MAGTLNDVWDAAERGFAAQEEELRAARTRQVLSVTSKTATGSADVDETFALDMRFRLVFLRCHFAGTAGTAPLVISLDSTSGSDYDTVLFTVTAAGTNQDVNLRIGGGDVDEPSPWTFQAGDAVRVRWTNPDSGNITWGLEVGLALAS